MAWQQYVLLPAIANLKHHVSIVRTVFSAFLPALIMFGRGSLAQLFHMMLTGHATKGA
jgi:hypothetical protein